MKKYTQPSIELTKFDVEDVIMASGTVSAGAGASQEVKDAAESALQGASYTVVQW